MNKRQKIIVSITGITLVLLILVGLTYAYFLTRIQGNTNTKSISVTTADLKIVYGDGNQNIITKEKIQPGEVIGEKDFTVTNEGNSESDYIVVIDAVNITNVTSSDTTTFSSNDFVYTLSCIQKNKNTGVVSGTCNGVSSETAFTFTDDSLLVANKIAENMMQEYVLTVKYKETNINQSADMNKKLEAKVDIKDIRAINPYSSNQNSLAYNIINNAMLKKNGTELRAVPITIPGSESALSNERELSLISDDYGTSYYYRGPVEDNYVDFAGMCWRIVRIEGDGSIKLVLASVNGVCEISSNLTENSAFIGRGNYGYNGDYADYENSINRANSQKSILNAFLNGGSYENTYFKLPTLQSVTETKTFTSFDSNNKSKLKNEQACIGDLTKKYNLDGTDSTNDLIWYYDLYKKITIDFDINLKCTGMKASSSKIYPLTATDIVLSGAILSSDSNTYLKDNAEDTWLSLSISHYNSCDMSFTIGKNGSLSNAYSIKINSTYIRPSVSLVSNTIISSGTGTQTNPYVIN